MDATQVKTKLIGYGFSLLEGIDPNPEVNFNCIHEAGSWGVILHNMPC